MSSSSSEPTKVLVFGPTGGVGAPTALTAASSPNTHVYLAMRDTSKPIPGLSPSQESSLGFTRIQADFSSPQSVSSAVSQSGATRAFVYLHMTTPLEITKSSISALKSAGIKFVVFLSSSSILGDADLESIAPTEFAAYAHAQIELFLEKEFGKDGYAAVRPAYFASNIFWWKNMVSRGKIEAVGPQVKFDWVVPGDIGAVCGTILAGGPTILKEKGFWDENNQGAKPVYLYGPKMLSLTEAIGMLGDVLGRKIPVETVDLEEGIKALVEINEVPEFAARPLMGMVDELVKSGRAETGGEIYHGWFVEEGVKNFERIVGRKSTELGEYLEGVKGVFSS